MQGGSPSLRGGGPCQPHNFSTSDWPKNCTSSDRWPMRMHHFKNRWPMKTQYFKNEHESHDDLPCK